MSVYKALLERDLSEIKTINYARLNCIIQDMADKLQGDNLTLLEVSLIVRAIKNREMLNIENATKFYRKENKKLLEIEGV